MLADVLDDLMLTSCYFLFFPNVYFWLCTSFTWIYLGLFSILFLILNLGSYTVWYALTPCEPRPPWALAGANHAGTFVSACLLIFILHLTSHSAVVRNKTITRIIPSFNLLMINKYSFSDWHCILHSAYLEVWFILLLLLGSGPNSFLPFHIHPIVLRIFMDSVPCSPTLS